MNTATSPAKITQLNASWQNWIQTNLARQCTPESLVEAMVRENFDLAFAQSCVRQEMVRASNPQAAAPATASASANAYRNEPPRIRRTGSVIQTSDRTVRVAMWMENPIIAVLDDLFSDEECDHLIELSASKLKRSTTVNPQTGGLDVIDGRSSMGTFFNLCENEFIATLDRRIAEVMNWPMENGEGIQILRYENGGEYKAHFDYFEPANPGSQVHLAKGGQRVSTLVMYLSDVPEGGETVFPDMHLSVVPRKGSAAYFEYFNSLGQVDPRSLHGGLPVTKGVKWIATKWMRERKYK